MEVDGWWPVPHYPHENPDDDHPGQVVNPPERNPYDHPVAFYFHRFIHGTLMFPDSFHAAAAAAAAMPQQSNFSLPIFQLHLILRYTPQDPLHLLKQPGSHTPA
eukprot:1160180-Pelagomonas_calceolata.AAC.4